MTRDKNNQAKPRPLIVRFVLKPLLWIISILLVLLVSVFVAFRFPKVQQFAAEKAISFLSDKLQTAVRLDKLSIDFPKAIHLEGLYMEDQKKDTLAWLKDLHVDVSLWDLLSNEITINNIQLSGVTGHISRNDSTFNFDFIVRAFAGAPEDTTEKKQQASKPWKFNVGTVSLDSVYFTFHDKVSGPYLDAHLGHFKGDVKDLDLENNRLKAGRLDLENTRVSYVQKKGTQMEQPDTVSSGSGFSPDVSEISLKNVQFSFTDEPSQLRLVSSVGNLELHSDKFDLNRQTVDLSELRLSNSSVFFRMGKASGIPDKLKDSSVASSGGSWRVNVKKLKLDNNTFGFDDDQKAPVVSGMDYSHLLAKNISIDAKEIYYGPEKITLKLNQLSLSEKSGLVVRKFSSEILYDSSQAELKALDLQTGNSSLKGDLSVRYGSLEELKRSTDALYINTSFNNTSVDLQDVFFFAPDLAKQPVLFNARRNRVRINGKLKGTLNELAISELELRLLESTLIRLNGTVRNVTKPEELYLKLSQLKVSSSKKDLQSVVPDTLLPASIEIPESFALEGSFTGYLKNFNTDLKLNTSIGTLSARAKMNPAAGNKEQPYSIYLTTQSFDAGKLLKQPQTLGPVTLRVEVKGEGRDTSNLHAEVTAAVESAVLKGYTYKDLNVSGRIDKQCVTAVASVKDRNIDFTFDGRINTDPTTPEYVFKLDLKGADLKALNLSEEDLRVSARIESDISDRKRKNPEGTASVRDLLILRDGKKYRLDSLVLRSEFKDSVAEINVESDIVSADFKGDITLSQLPASITELLNGYFNMHSPAPKKKLNPQRFKFEMRLKDATLLTNNTVPHLEKITPFSISGEYNSSAKKIKLNGAVPQIIYSGVRIDSLRLSVDSDQEKLNASVGANQVSNSTFKFENFSFATELKNDVLAFQFNTNKDDSSKSIGLGGKVSSTTKGYELKFDQELIFNGDRWNVDAANLLVIGKTGIYANKVVLSNGSRAIAINSAGQTENAPLEIRFTDFDLTVVSRMVENNNDLVKGFIDGNIILEKKNNASAFRSDIVVRDFAFKAVPVGTIKLKADNYGNSSVYSVDLSVEGNGNDIRANGSYNAASKTNNLDLDLAINNLNLASIEPFTFGQVSRMSGAVNGKIDIKGTPAKPELNGHIDFKEAALRPKAIDSYLTIHDGRLNLGSKRLTFNNLAIYDSLNNKATVNGHVGIEDLTALTFDLDVKSTNFLALNTDSKDNPVYYGRIFLDSDIGIRGTQSAPRVNVKAKLNKGSYITYVKPESVVTKNESKGIVEFSDSLYQDAIMTRVNDTIDGSSDIKGIDLHATVNFDRTVQLKMFVDPENGDSLYVVGGGTLDFGLDRSGKTSLTGRYRINDGGYHLSISDLVKRNFKIENGSYVTWQGDVLDAYVDIKAVYTIKTSPIDLVQNEISAMSESERNKYRNLLTFNVYLKMTGFISSPEISFDIQLAPGDRGALNGAINSKLAQLREDETELNKQVFALLTLRRFIGENPLDNGNDGGGLTSASRSSASKVLTQQLSNLSDKYVNFVDLDLGVNSFEDYSTGTEQGRTQLQLGVSKQLLNDKVSVHVGGNVELEGERAKQNNASDVAGNISIDYKLTKDGRYKLKAFRENQYENPIEGELTKTGMGFIYTRNYNTFKELFSKPVKKQDPIVIIHSVEKSASDKAKEEETKSADDKSKADKDKK